ncbi:MAG: hypothetical protein A4E44_00474 [Methanosaeta sp. PtaB.Bin018]|jgi:hypothetical protein|nr:hypothetical protein [Methanothrix sp.]OPX76674.1 MAG: hypothetical protein A4E44_00474 [Methanosaeta sp. PtaB.Bin018]OPY48275.1 MAG: hypothetical protein A4E46_00023 [Methanosaeta sp. PtaU1.Bin016]
MNVKCWLIILALASFIVSTANAISDSDKTSLGMAGESVLTSMPEILYADVSFGWDDSMDIWIVPTVIATGGSQEEISEDLIKIIAGAMGVYVGTYHEYNDVGQMGLTIGADKTKSIGTAYCLPEWAAEVRYNGYTPNEDDLGNLGLKILGTLKVSS